MAGEYNNLGTGNNAVNGGYENNIGTGNNYVGGYYNYVGTGGNTIDNGKQLFQLTQFIFPIILTKLFSSPGYYTPYYG